MRFKYLYLVLAILILSLIPFYACSPAPAVEKPIKIGVCYDFSGVGSSTMPLHETGILLKLSEVNSEFNGRKIEVIRADDAGDPIKGAEAVTKLIQVDKVDIVVGPVWGHVAMAIAPVLAQYKTPHLITGGQPIEVLQAGGGNTLMARGTFAGNSYYSGVYAYEDLGYRTAVVLQDDFVSGDAYMKGFAESFEGKGGKIIQHVKVPLNTFDFAPFLSELQNADLCAYWIIPNELAAFYKQYHEFGLKMPLMYTTVQACCDTWREVGPLSTGTIGQHEWSPYLDNEANKKFMTTYNNSSNKEEMCYQEAGWVAASIILEALKTTNGDTSYEKFIGALRSVSVDTPEGKISFDSKGMGIGDERIVKLRDDGTQEAIKTYSQVIRSAPSER